MAKRRRGRMGEITQGDYKGKNVLMYNDEQNVNNNGKVCCHVVEPKTFLPVVQNGKPLKTLITYANIKLTGFFD